MNDAVGRAILSAGAGRTQHMNFLMLDNVPPGIKAKRLRRFINVMPHTPGGGGTPRPVGYGNGTLLATERSAHLSSSARAGGLPRTMSAIPKFQEVRKSFTSWQFSTIIRDGSTAGGGRSMFHESAML